MKKNRTKKTLNPSVKKRSIKKMNNNSKKNRIKTIDYQDYLIETLKDKEEAIGYLNAALLGGDVKVFLLALHNVIKAQGGVAIIAKKAQKSRTSLYKSISSDGNPHLKSANEILSAMGMHLAVVANNARLT